MGLGFIGFIGFGFIELRGMGFRMHGPAPSLPGISDQSLRCDVGVTQTQSTRPAGWRIS